MVSEIGTHDYLHAVRMSFVDSMVVVRGLLSEQEIQYFKQFIPDTGKKRVYTRPQLWVPLNQAVSEFGGRMPNKAVGRLIRSKLGGLSTLYLQKADMLRRGDAAPHIDDRTVALSTSINLDDADETTELRAHRIAESNAPYGEIVREWNAAGIKSVSDFEDRILLEPGDAVLIGRGVAHSSVTGVERESMVVRTRGIIS